MVAEDTFRRVVSPQRDERVHGPRPRAYDAQGRGFRAGGASLHNSFSAHGPDRATFDRASTLNSAAKIADTLAFMSRRGWSSARPNSRSAGGAAARLRCLLVGFDHRFQP